MDEFQRIARLEERLRRKEQSNPSVEVRVGIGDDAAVLALPPGADTLLTTDTMVEGVHFLRQTLSWYDVGYKCLAASISDIAAMGGSPATAVLSVAAPRELEFTALEEMYDGIGDLALQYGCAVTGGDLVSTSGPVVVTSTVLGWVDRGAALLRSTAQPGDIVFATGHLGASAGGLHVLQHRDHTGGVFSGLDGDEQALLLKRHRRPQAQVTAGQVLRASGVRCCNDVSDGLASEANEIAAASQVRLRIEADRIPVAPAVRNYARRLGLNALDFALYGGEDYELVGTASSFAFARALAKCEGLGIRLTAIGRVEQGDGVILQQRDGTLEVLRPKGYNHFTDSSDGAST